MSKYTAEQVEAEADCLPDAYEDQAAKLRDYAALLRERESAKAAVTDEMIKAAAYALAEYDGADPNQLIWQGNPPEPWGEIWNRYEGDARAALEAVAPMLASVRVPDGWSIGETKVTGAQEIGVWLCDGKSLQVIHPGDSMAANLPFYLIKAMLVAATKTEEK